jgi:transcriptional regulator with XRE-family HTH domain
MAWPSERIRELRTRRSWTQKQLADAIAASPRAVNAWEAGSAAVSKRFIRELDRLAADAPDAAPDRGPYLHEASDADLAAEVVRRLTEAAAIRQHARVRTGEAPPDLGDRGHLLRGPSTEEPRGDTQAK